MSFEAKNMSAMSCFSIGADGVRCTKEGERMIRNLSISNFKKFKSLQLEDFSRINLFVGANNVGKTSLLEAIFAFACGKNASVFFPHVVYSRLQDGMQLWQSPYLFMEAVWNTFHEKNKVQDLTCTFEGDIDGSHRKVVHRFTPGAMLADFLPNEMGAFGTTALQRETKTPTGKAELVNGDTILGNWQIEIDGADSVRFSLVHPFFKNIPLFAEPLVFARKSDILAHRDETENLKVFSFFSRAGLVQEVIREMNKCFTGDPIVDISTVPYPDGSASPINVRFASGGSYPLYALGDGMRRWFQLIGSMLVYRDAVHCIEEIDATLHHEAQEEFSYHLCRYAKKYAKQLFITTHDQEYLQAFLQAVAKHEAEGLLSLQDDIRVITLREVNHEVRSRVLNGSEAASALSDGWELRV